VISTFLQIAVRRWTTEHRPKPGEYTVALPGLPGQRQVTLNVQPALAVDVDGERVYVSLPTTDTKTRIGPNGVVWLIVTDNPPEGSYDPNKHTHYMHCPRCGTVRFGRAQDTHRVWLCLECAAKNDRHRRTSSQHVKRHLR